MGGEPHPMTHGSHYLGKLYNDLIANSPQTISIDIPSDMGKGRIAQTQIKHGIIFSDWQMCYQSDMNVQGTVSKDYMQIIFCLNDAISWGIMDEKRSITIQKNESCIYAGHGGTEYACYKKDSNFSFKSIKIPIAYFSQLLTDYFDGQEATAYEKKLLDGISKVPVTPIMEQILAETSQFTQYRGGLGYLYLDGKLLELLSIYLGEVLELDILMGKNVSMSRTERTAIMEAKRIIDSQLAFAPSCEELSHLVHLSTTKLTRGFSSFYGMPICPIKFLQSAFVGAMEKNNIAPEYIQGIHSMAGDAGKMLSGGQRQRISLARAILKDAPIVVLDEATAYADPENEEKMEAAIAELVKGKTLVVIAHKLPAIMNADQICVIDHGKLVAAGKHQDLIRSCPEYQKLWKAAQDSAEWKVHTAKEGA